MTDKTESTGGGQWEREADGPVDCDVIFSITTNPTQLIDWQQRAED